MGAIRHTYRYYAIYGELLPTSPPPPAEGEQEKVSIIRVRMGYTKYVPRDHRLTSLDKLRDAKR